MCRCASLDPPASPVAEPTAGEEEDEGNQQEEPEQRAHSDSARYCGDDKHDQEQLYEAHGTLLCVDSSGLALPRPANQSQRKREHSYPRRHARNRQGERARSARVRILGIQVARPVGPVGVQHVVAVEVGAGDLAHRPEASREVPVLTQRRHPGRAETEPRPGFRPPKHAPRRSAAGPAVHQRPYQRRPPPVDAPPTKKPISHSRTAKISTYHSTCAANPSPPNTASNSSSTM